MAEVTEANWIKPIQRQNLSELAYVNLRDALMQALYGGLGAGTLRRGRVVDVSKIKQKISGALANLMGEDIVEEVLIQGISQRKL